MIHVVKSSAVIQSHGSLFKLCFEVSSSEACSGYITVTKDFLNGMYNITILKLIHIYDLLIMLYVRDGLFNFQGGGGGGGGAMGFFSKENILIPNVAEKIF